MNNQPDKKFFAYTPDEGFKAFSEEKDAIELAQFWMAYYRQEAQDDGEWPGEIEEIFYGTIDGRSEIDRTGVDDNGADWVDYDLIQRKRVVGWFDPDSEDYSRVRREGWIPMYIQED